MKEANMKYCYGTLCRFMRDERGGEVVEYALVAGLLWLLCVGPMAAFGTKVLNLWKALDRSLSF
jgi:Flp pilus assembly pilin Flp